MNMKTLDGGLEIKRGCAEVRNTAAMGIARATRTRRRVEEAEGRGEEGADPTRALLEHFIFVRVILNYHCFI